MPLLCIGKAFLCISEAEFCDPKAGNRAFQAETWGFADSISDLEKKPRPCNYMGEASLCSG
jgi:hypothetical protein